jgi:hypothetical protein
VLLAVPFGWLREWEPAPLYVGGSAVVRKLSVVLIALGAFLIVLAPMVRWYAYPRVAVAPANQRSVTTLVGPGATIFDINTLKEITTDLTTKVRTTGDASTPDKCPGDVTYVNSTSTTSSDGIMRSRDVERMTFDAKSGLADPSCNAGDFISTTEGVQEPIKHEGLVAKFPIPTEKKSYNFWDGSLKAATPIKYTGTASVEGVDVYTFENTTEPTKVGTQELPLSLLGLDGTENVTADEMYSVTRKLWVEPETGVILKRSEKVLNTLDYDGQTRLTLTSVDTQYDTKTVKHNADEYGSQGRMLHLVRSVVPLVSLVLGLLLLFVGLTLARRRTYVDDETDREYQEMNA